MLNHTSSLRYAVAGEIPVFTTLRRGRHEINKITFRRIFSLKTFFVLLACPVVRQLADIRLGCFSPVTAEHGIVGW